MSKVPVKRNSTTHVALQYLKMKNTWITESNLYDLAPVKFKSISKAKNSLDRLVVLQYALYNDTSYMISQHGLTALYKIIKEQPRKTSMTD